MSTYTKKKCSNCGFVIEDWHKNNEYWRDKIGAPYEECPKCKALLRNLENVEFVMLEHPKLYITLQLFLDLIKSVLLGLILMVLLINVFELEETSAIIGTAVVCVVLMFILHLLAFSKLVRESKKRTSNEEYLYFLHRQGLISKNKYEAEKRNTKNN